MEMVRKLMLIQKIKCTIRRAWKHTYFYKEVRKSDLSFLFNLLTVVSLCQHKAIKVDICDKTKA